MPKHCLLKGSKLLDGRLKAKQQKKFYLELFDQIDVNKDDLVDEDELNRALNNSGAKMVKEKLQKLMALVDEDNDGKINRKEWAFAVDFFLQHEGMRKIVSEKLEDEDKDASISEDD